MHFTSVLVSEDCSVQAIPTARNSTILDQMYTILSNSNTRFYINVSGVGACASCEKVKLVADEILALAVAPK